MNLVVWLFHLGFLSLGIVIFACGGYFGIQAVAYLLTGNCTAFGCPKTALDAAVALGTGIALMSSGGGVALFAGLDFLKELPRKNHG